MDLFTVVRRSPLLFPLACAAAVVMLFISEGSYRQSVDTLDALGGMGAARAQIQGLERSVLHAESAQRGYLLTHNPSYLQPYDKATRDLHESLMQLDRYYGSDPQSLALLGKLRRVIDAKLSELALTISVHDEGRMEAARDLVQTGIGAEKLDGVLALSAELLALQSRKVAQSREDIYQTLLLSRVGLAALSLFSLLALFSYSRQTRALEAQREEQQRRVQGERDRLEDDVRLRTAQLTELNNHLQTAREDERSRLARDLHDELGALLTSAKLDAARIRSRLAAREPEALERLTHLTEALNSGIALKRRIIEDLRPSALSNLGLVATLEILAREFGERAGVEVDCELSAVRLDATGDLVVYRVVQEALTNIAKYARARHVWIGLATRDGQVHVSVRDDGVGFDAGATTNSAHGLVGMRFRVEAEGGTLSVVSAPGSGASIKVVLPQSTPED